MGSVAWSYALARWRTELLPTRWKCVAIADVLASAPAKTWRRSRALLSVESGRNGLGKRTRLERPSVYIHTSSARRERLSTRPTRCAAHNTPASLPHNTSQKGKGCPRCSGKPSIMTTSQQDTTPRNYWNEVQYDATGGATSSGTFQCYGGCGVHQRAVSSRYRCGTLLLMSRGAT